MGRTARAATGMAAASALYQRYGEARDRRRHPPPGRLVNIGGRCLHVIDHGGTGPTVVIETGSGALARAWDEIVPLLTPFARVVAYDRAGYGWSDADGWRRTGTGVARDLHDALAAIDIAPPYVLVGHSLGGLYACCFLDAYPDDVAGLVLVDASHEEMLPRVREALGLWVLAAQVAASLLMAVAPRGLLRAVVDTGAADRRLPSMVGGTGDESRLRVSLYLRSAFRKAMVAELLGMTATMKLVRRGRRRLAIPLAVVTAAEPPANDSSMMAGLRPVWIELQADLASLSSDTSHVTATAGGHFVQNDDPGVVVDAIAEVVRKLG